MSNISLILKELYTNYTCIKGSASSSDSFAWKIKKFGDVEKLNFFSISYRSNFHILYQRIKLYQPYIVVLSFLGVESHVKKGENYL